MRLKECVFLVLFIFSSSEAWAMGHLSVQASNDPLIGKSAQDFMLTKTDGKSGMLIGPQKGKEVILIFWATWCSHCYEELGAINDGLASIEEKGIKIKLVDVGETKEDVKNYFKQRHMKLVSFVDEDSIMQAKYHLIGVPTLIFIDKKGIIRNVTHAFPSDYENYFSVR